MAKAAKKPVAPAPGLRLPKKSVSSDQRQYVGADIRPVLVELPGGPKVVVEASNNREAWEKYKVVAGIVATDHQPKFSKPGIECVTNEAGIVVDTRGLPLYGDLKRPDQDEDWELEEGDADDEE